MLLKKELIVNFQNQSRFCRNKRKWKELKIHSHWLLCVKELIGSHSTHIEVSKGWKKKIKRSYKNQHHEYMWVSRLEGKEMFAGKKTKKKKKKSVSMYVWVMKTWPYRIIHPKRYPFSAAACLPKQNPSITHSLTWFFFCFISLSLAVTSFLAPNSSDSLSLCERERESNNKKWAKAS